MKITRTIFIAAIVLLLVSPISVSHAQQERQVYITLDVSGSMTGDKYLLANYTAQMIATMCNEKDDVYLIVDGKERLISSNELSIKLIQVPIDHFGGIKNASISEFNDIVQFNKIYKPSNNKQNWLFIVGDGIWNIDENEFGKFQKTVESGTLTTCYLQTHNGFYESSFTEHVKELGIVDIQKSDNDGSTIMDKCKYFSRKIMGFSDVDLKIEKASNENSVVLSADLPTSGFIVVYQENVLPTNLPSITKASAKGESLCTALKGTPSTEKLGNRSNNIIISGNVWEIQTSFPIAAGTEVVVTFDRNVSLSNMTVFPIVSEQIISSFTLHSLSTTKNIDAHTSAICRSEQSAEVAVNVGEAALKKIPKELLKKTKVVVIANNKRYKTKFDGSKYVCNIPLNNEETQYNAEIDCPGYFKITTPTMKIVKTDDCQKKEEEVKEMPEMYLGQHTLEELGNLDLTLIDSSTKDILDPSMFNLELELDHSFLYEDPVIRIDGETIHLEIRTKKNICECLVPSILTGRLIATPKVGAVFDGDKQYSSMAHPIRADIIKENSFWSRCSWVVFTICGLIILLIYIRLLKNKCRFKKNAIINPCHVNELGKKVTRSGYKLRKRGLAAWFCRWFLPWDEKRAVTSNNQPRGSFTFVATRYKSKIQFPVSQFDKSTMRVTGYDPKFTRPKDKYVPLNDGGEISISQRNGVKDGSLIFVAGRKNDEGAYITFLLILMLAAIFTIGFLLFFMLNGLWGKFIASLITIPVVLIISWFFLFQKK